MDWNHYFDTVPTDVLSTVANLTQVLGWLGLGGACVAKSIRPILLGLGFEKKLSVHS